MKVEHIRSFAKPKGKFHPFIVRTASGAGCMVRSPEFVWMPGDGEVVMIYEPDVGVTLIDADDVTECHREIKSKKPR